MDTHVTTWLETYYDGELRGMRLRQVESHLARCAACRAELAGLRGLSDMLREAPGPEGLMPADRFIAQVGLRLPRRPDRSAWQRVLEGGWRSVPVLLLGAWVFVQSVLLVTNLILLALRVGLGGDLFAEGLSAPSGGITILNLLSLSWADLGGAVRFVLSGGGLLGWGFWIQTISLGVIGLLYWSWLASWWARNRHRSQNGGTV